MRLKVRGARCEVRTALAVVLLALFAIGLFAICHRSSGAVNGPAFVSGGVGGASSVGGGGGETPPPAGAEGGILDPETGKTVLDQATGAILLAP